MGAMKNVKTLKMLAQAGYTLQQSQTKDNYCERKMVMSLVLALNQ